MNTKRKHKNLQNRDAMIMVVAKGFVNACKKNQFGKAGSEMAEKNQERIMLFSNEK
jgi:hypothetical protein